MIYCIFNLLKTGIYIYTRDISYGSVQIFIELQRKDSSINEEAPRVSSF